MVGTGCALWDEPFISPELADQTKLVLEGKPDITITIKQKSAEKLGKRVPVIITSKSHLWKYCSNEATPFLERCFKFDFTKQITSSYYCTHDEHYCSCLDSTSGTNNPFTSDVQLQDNQRGWTSENHFVDCERSHPIEQNHGLSFLVFCMYKFRFNFDVNKKVGTFEEYCKLAELFKKFPETLCYCSKNLTVHPSKK